jgi:hypothetical protein
VPVIEPVVSRERLDQLLSEQHESAALDYEATVDLNERRDIVELAKDIGAMSTAGGPLLSAHAWPSTATASTTSATPAFRA